MIKYFEKSSYLRIGISLFSAILISCAGESEFSGSTSVMAKQEPIPKTDDALPEPEPAIEPKMEVLPDVVAVEKVEKKEYPKIELEPIVTELEQLPRDIDGINPEDFELVSMGVKFQRLPDGAAWDNCIFARVNIGEETKLGCNHSGGANVNIEVPVRKKPFCNVFRFRLTSNGNPNFDTSNINRIREGTDASYNVAGFLGFKFFMESDDSLLVIANDNGDGTNDSDGTFRITGLSQINFRVERTSIKSEDPIFPCRESF